MIALLSGVPNPYGHARVDSAWDAPPVDVADIHQEPFDACARLVAGVAADRQSHGAILTGQPGAGKTHVLARLRRHVVEGERGWFVYVRPVTAPDRFFRHVLHALAGDILRPPHGAVTSSQLEVALARHMMADAHAPSTSVAGWWDTVRAHHPEPRSLEDFLRPGLEAVAELLGMDLHVARVVLQLASRRHRPQARAWLLGRAITEEDCALLGVPGSLDDESAAEDAVVTLLGIAGEGFPVVLAFDQIEGLQRTRDDTEGLMALAHGVERLFSRCRNVAALTCAQVMFLEDLRAVVGKALYEGRLAERGELSLKPLLARQAVELARRRSAVCTDLQQVRLLARQKAPATAGVEDPLWPLQASRVELLALQAPTPREILKACRDAFEAERAAPPPPAETLDRVWTEALERERQNPVDVIDEGVYVDGLLRAIDATVPGASASRSKVKDVDMEVRRGATHTGVSVCNAEHMTSLAGRLRRLGAVAPRFTRLAVVRDARLPIKKTARATLEYLDKLQASGGTLTRPPVEAYLALAALRNLLAEAAAGDLTVDGRTVPPTELKEWLARNAPAAVVDLVDELTGEPGPAVADDVRERIVEVLRRLKVVELEALAREAAIGAERVRTLATVPGSGLGLLEGTPPVVFLHPDAVERA